MKTIGIVGGLSPESTILYYTNIIEEYRRRYSNEEYPEIIIYSVNFGKFTRLMEEGKFKEAADIITKAIKALHKAGADFAIISANTPHIAFDYIVSQSPIPLISIIDSLAEELKKENVEKIGLLGTKFTLIHGFYAEGLRKHGIIAIVPDLEDVEVINRIIYEELTRGIVNECSRKLLLKIIEKLVRKGAEAIALACTELPLILRENMANVKLYDTAKIHSIKALEYALKE